MVLWFTGLSGSGKTTICKYLYSRLKCRIPEIVILDGDSVRESISTDLGFSESDRIRQVTRVQRLAKILSDQGLIVLVAVVYANPKLLEWNRREINGYFEILIDAPLRIVQARDPKGIYASARRGEIKNIVGLDLPWHRAGQPDLVITPETHGTPENAAEAVALAVPALARHWKPEGGTSVN